MELIPADEQTRFYPPRLKLLLLAFSSVFFAGVGGIMTLAEATIMATIGWLLLIGFGGATVVMLARALRPGPTLVLDAQGITDRTTLAPTGLVRWEQITVVRKREIGRGRGSERLLDVVLADPQEFATRARSLPRRLTEAYRRMLKHPEVSIAGSMVAQPMQAVIDELQRRRPELQVLGLPPPLPKASHVFSKRARAEAQRNPKPPRW